MNLQSRPTERSQLCLCRARNAVLVRLPFGVPAFLDAFCGGWITYNDKFLIINIIFRKIKILIMKFSKISKHLEDFMKTSMYFFIEIPGYKNSYPYPDIYPGIYYPGNTWVRVRSWLQWI